MSEKTPSEQTLDPQNWDGMRQLGHQMVDDIFAYLKTVRERQVWQKPTESAKATLNIPAPERGSSPGTVYQDFKDNILPFAMGSQVAGVITTAIITSIYVSVIPLLGR